MKSYWTYRDLIDLIFFFDLDRDTSQDELHQRDRSIYLADKEREQDKTAGSLLHNWLNRRREVVFADTGGRSPGTVLIESLQFLSIMLLLCGLVIGTTGGLSFFAYSGNTPVNVFNFLFIFVFSQLALVLILLVSLVLRLSGAGQLPSAIVQLYGTLISFSVKRIGRPVLAKLPADRRYGYEQAFGIFKKNRSYYSPLLYWPLFNLSQVFMVAINCGLLAATLFKIITSDIAFGWQSTIQFTAPAVYQGVRILATPWSWLLSEGSGHPTLAEIEGSRIILKDGIHHLATGDLISWWPFLLLCLLVYGLFLRILLVAVGKYLQKRSMNNTTFINSPEALRTMQRMSTPLMASQAGSSGAGSRTVPKPDYSAGLKTVAARAPLHPLTLLIPGDISTICPSEKLCGLLGQLGFSIDQHETIMLDHDSDRVILEKLAARTWRAESGLLIIFEAWMVPINDTLLFLRDLRTAVGKKTPIYIGLIGRPENARLLSPPNREESSIWRRKLDTLADPFLLVQEFYSVDNT